MNFIHRIVNFGHLFWINLKRNFFKEVLLGLGVILATIILILGTFFGDVVEDLHKESFLGKIPVDQIKINGTFSPTGYNSINPNHIEQIKSIDQVKDITLISEATFPCSIFITINPSPSLKLLGVEKQTFFFEAPIVGIPNSLGNKFLKKAEAKNDFPEGFQRHDGTVPILVTNYAQFYMNNFVQSNKLPINILNFIHLLQVDLLMNHSVIMKRRNFGNFDSSNPLHIKGRIVGFADIGVTKGLAIPIDELNKIKKMVLDPDRAEGYESAIIHLNEGSINQVSEELYPQLEKWSLKLDEEILSFQTISRNLVGAVKSFKVAVMIFSGLILLLTGLAIFYAFLYLVIRRSKEIGLYRFFGGTKVQVISILLFESALIGGLCAGIGYLISHFLLTYYFPTHLKELIDLIPQSIIHFIFPTDKELNQFQESFIHFDTGRNLYYALICGLTSVVAALFPALIGSSANLYKSIQGE